MALIKNLFHLILFIGLLFPLPKWLASNQEKIDKKIIERASKRYLSVKKSNQLDMLLSEELSALPKKSLSAQIIAEVFNANFTAANVNRLNEKSTNLFKRASLKAKTLNQTDIKIWVSLQYAYYLYSYNRYQDSYPLFAFCIKNLDQTEDGDVIQFYETYKKVAYFLTSVGDNAKAITYLLKAKEKCKKNSSEMAAITDALGLCNVNSNKLREAEKYFNETLVIAKANHDELRYAKALGNLANINFKNKQYTIAIERLTEDIAISKKLFNTKNSIYALKMLAKIYIETKEYEKATTTLNSAVLYAQSTEFLKSDEYEIYVLLRELAKIKKDDTAELLAGRKLDELKILIGTLDGKEVITKIGWELERNKLIEKTEIEKQKGQQESVIKIIALVSLIISCIIFYCMIKSYKRKTAAEKVVYDKKVSKLELNKILSENKLNDSQQTIESYNTYLTEKNQQIKQLQFEIKSINESPKNDQLEEYSERMHVLLKSHLMSNDSWLDFKKIFIQSYPSYYNSLTDNFNDLTDAQLRIIFLTKLKKNNNEIAQILSLTPDAIKKAKQRLKTKYKEEYNLIFDRSV